MCYLQVHFVPSGPRNPRNAIWENEMKAMVVSEKKKDINRNGSFKCSYWYISWLNSVGIFSFFKKCIELLLGAHTQSKLMGSLPDVELFLHEDAGHIIIPVSLLLFTHSLKQNQRRATCLCVFVHKWPCVCSVICATRRCYNLSLERGSSLIIMQHRVA